MAEALLPHKCFHIIIVPSAYPYPKMKPRACNYALKYATGEFVTIYDAEDIPDVLQLKKVISKFIDSPEVSCIQAKLEYYNYNESWLCAMFAIEYEILFQYINNALSKLKLPIPLGGSSNHFRIEELRQMKCWDPYNVTEDADLGMRMANLELRVETINSTTKEEAVIHLRHWIKQRTRWIKGHLQTFLVHSRSSKGIKGDLKKRLFFYYVMLLSPLSTIFFPISLFLVFESIFNFKTLFHSDVNLFFLAVFLFGIFILSFTAFLVIYRKKRWKGVIRICWILYPFYFLCHWVASISRVA